MKVAIDSRQVEPGDCFYALPGERTDGHEFLEQAAERGAVAAVVSDNYAGDHHGLQLRRVPDVLLDLQEAGCRRLKEVSAKVVAVTGSVGKTTTKEFIAELLRPHFQVHATKGNQNTQITLPLTLLNLKGDEEVVVLEMGMSAPGQIKRLAEIAPPNIAVLTAVTYVHAEFFESLEQIKQAKAEIFSQSTTELAIFPEEIELTTHCKQIRLGLDYAIKEGICIRERNRIHGPIAFPLPGAHNRRNLLAAVAVARALGVSWKALAETIPTLSLPKLRLEQLEKRGVTLIRDCYNACALSVCAAIDSLPKSQGKSIVVLSEMLELGRFSEESHLQVARAAEEGVDQVLCIGPGCGPLVAYLKKAGRAVEWFEEKEPLTRRLREIAQPGDLVLVKGARKYALEDVVMDF